MSITLSARVDNKGKYHGTIAVKLGQRLVSFHRCTAPRDTRAEAMKDAKQLNTKGA